jgi:hypothetical protein
MNAFHYELNVCSSVSLLTGIDILIQLHFLERCYGLSLKVGVTSLTFTAGVPHVCIFAIAESSFTDLIKCLFFFMLFNNLQVQFVDLRDLLFLFLPHP